MDILLNKARNLKSVNKNNSISISLNRNAKLLPFTDFEDKVNLYEVYEDERNKSDIFRLFFSIHPYCSNVLFNNFTEIVHYVKSDNGFDRYGNQIYDCELIHYNKDYKIDANREYKADTIKDFKTLEYKGNNFQWNAYEMIKDTQLSNEKCGYIYYIGLNIFNNHLLRKNTFKAVCNGEKLDEDEKKNFNTIYDLLREYDGEIVKSYSDIEYDEVPKRKLHLYLREDILSFKKAVEERLSEKDGWLGFTNKSTIETYIDDSEEFPVDLGISKPINNAKACEFVYMYPTPDLFSFTPKYNQFKNRFEKNWNYALTYPSSSTTIGFEDIIDMSFKNINNKLTNLKVNSLKVGRFVELSNEIIFYSRSKHGLKVGDIINVYSTQLIDETEQAIKIINNAEVISLGDENNEDKEFIFTISNEAGRITNQWAEVTTDDYKAKKIELDGQTYIISPSKTCCYIEGEDILYPITKNLLNTDKNKQKISFKKVVNGTEVEYYVRIFSRLPNWKFADTKVDEYNIYDNPKTKDLLKTYQSLDKDFVSINSDLLYSKTIYNDDVSQIVFTDDIDLSYLHDNLGRPLSEIFLTIVKNNRGYKRWYNDGKYDDESKNANNHIVGKDSQIVEFSHAFGKVNCAFNLSKYCLFDDTIKNAKFLFNTSIDEKSGNTKRSGIPIIKKEINGITYGINTRVANANNGNSLIDDEIDFYQDIHYYGDLCSYSSSNAIEEHIQYISHRFNTAQREASKVPFMDDDKLLHDEILTDDWDKDGFQAANEDNYTEESSITGLAVEAPINPPAYLNARMRKEGYLYCPHYQIQLHTFSNDFNSYYPHTFRIVYIDKKDGYYTIITNNINYFQPNDKLLLFNNETSETYNVQIVNMNNNIKPILNKKTFNCKMYDENWENEIDSPCNMDNKATFKILKCDESIPLYAKLMKDGTVRYAWRNLIKNGFDNESAIEVFPFTNGAYYVTSRINFFLTRQDPHYEIKKWTKNGESLKPDTYPFDTDGKNIDVDKLNNYFKEKDIIC